MGLWGKRKVEFPEIATRTQKGREGEMPSAIPGTGRAGRAPPGPGGAPAEELHPGARQNPRLAPFGAGTVSFFCRQVFVNHLRPVIVLPAEKGPLQGEQSRDNISLCLCANLNPLLPNPLKLGGFF